MAITTNEPIKVQIQERIDANTMQPLHPETDAEVVKFDNTNAAISGIQNESTVQEAIEALKGVVDGISGEIINGVVTGVKGNSETTYRKGNVNITAANVGAYTTGEIDSKISTINSNITKASNAASAAQGTADTAKANAATAQSTADAAAGAAAAAQGTANEALTLAQGRARAVSFDTQAAMLTALNNAAKTDYKVGDNLFIKATNVPDYWISAVRTSKGSDTGWFEISELETQKVDLTSYAKTADVDSNIATAKNEVVTSISNSLASGALTPAKATLATEATELQTARKIALSGAVAATGVAFDGSQDITLTTALATDSVGSAQIVAGAVGSSELATDSVLTAKIKDANVTSAKLATDSVLTAKIKDANVTTAKIADANVTAAKLASGAVTTAKIADGNVTSAKLENSGVTAGTYSCIHVNAKGIATGGGQFIEIESTAGAGPSANLCVGGIFYKKLS